MDSSFLTLNNKKFDFKTIRENGFSDLHLNDFERNTLNFCRDWLNKRPKFILHTSGSTGKPKSIELTAEQMKLSAKMTIEALGLRKNDTALVCLNTAYVAGIMMLVRGLEGDLKMIIKEPSANPIADLDESISIDFTALVPYQLQNILEDPISFQKFSKIKKVIIGGASINPELESRMQDLQVAMYQTYGMTETVSHIALRRINGPGKSNYYTVLPNTHIDQDFRGCLKILSPVTQDQWLTTNDLVKVIDEKKFLWIGRADNVINSGGVKLQIEEIESAVGEILNSQGFTNRFFISGIPHPTLGESVALILEGVTSEKIKNTLFEQFSQKKEKYLFPKKIYFISEFKQTPTGKILRKENLSDLELI